MLIGKRRNPCTRLWTRHIRATPTACTCFMHFATCCLQSFDSRRQDATTGAALHHLTLKRSLCKRGISCSCPDIRNRRWYLSNVPTPGLDKYLVCRLHISAGPPPVGEWRVDVHTARNCVAGSQGIRHTFTVHLSD